MKTPDRPWKKLPDETLSRNAVAVATEVAGRMRKALGPAPDESTSAHPLDSKAGEPPRYAAGRGAIGIAFLTAHLDLCMPGEDWDQFGHSILQSSAAALAHTPNPGLGLFTGVTGAALAALLSCHGGARYRKLLESLDGYLIPATSHRLRALGDTPAGLPDYEYDLISGVTGIGAYLLSRADREPALDQLRQILSWLVQLMTRCTDGLPNWHTPGRFLSEDQRTLFPNGMLNCGLAHGIPGPLALLSIATRQGVIVAGQTEAITAVADWLLQNRADDRFGLNWPHAVPASSPVTPGLETTSLPPAPVRAAWCYGSPGVARALWLAGDALGLDRYKTAALDAMGAVFKRPEVERRLDSPIFCHGLAGLLQITMRLGNDADCSELVGHAIEICAQILSLYDPQSTFGFATPVVPGYSDSPDNPSLLEGCAGIALTLLACGFDVEPAWDRIFLLS